MKRRTFVKSGIAAATLAGLPLAHMQASNPRAEKPFNLKYAPHIGMFKHHAGKDPIDQIKFMADQGFRAM